MSQQTDAQGTEKTYPNPSATVDLKGVELQALINDCRNFLEEQLITTYNQAGEVVSQGHPAYLTPILRIHNYFVSELLGRMESDGNTVTYDEYLKGIQTIQVAKQEEVVESEA